MIKTYKRAIQFGVMLWVIIFVVFSIILFLPPLQNKELLPHIILWILLLPITLGLTKWYFKAIEPTGKRGFQLGIIALLVGTFLDLTITQLFVPGTYQQFITSFYGDWKLYVGFAEILCITTIAGFEFDGTYSKDI
ncbi:MAG: hypothetical protein GW939_04195 [Candidatus Magasanikbacteria bacterium]|uniref:Uncharacterized protein n=1 Tax=Candidatus Magasanikbacteria bacterium CG10_big_fil_rev_8_21_14_0_10_38_6 TaxID=1974647 RepID=A0A2M6P0X8_9BACT|nr:hypothetical protein [Candidatus Magasanikbacteria bacterium]NCS72330.1 hypothetical protein [Candidatus Magasanikbacteria bacterium]PIR77357.1 MAG: hypothetical protein COU30_02885 [Candidatus Magasanikbacteria bacterium CG10_big_fil_rev_8_21_14_0_10_38_6]